jgi:DNA gyrase inhibitor GyrI
MEVRILDPAKVRIVELPPCKVASFTGFGAGPENIAWKALFAWMKEHGLKVEDGRFLGFNNPTPTPGNPNYGYEQWLLLDDGAKRAAPASGGVEIKDYPGGLYAVTRHRGRPELLPGTWTALRLWVESSHFRPSERQWLEECLNPGLLLKRLPPWGEFAFDIYMAVER